MPSLRTSPPLGRRTEPEALKSPARPLWSSADARLAKAMLHGVRPIRRPAQLEALQPCVGGSKIKVMSGCILEAFATEGLGPFFRADTISTIGLSFLTFGGVLEPHMRGVKKQIGSPNRPHDEPQQNAQNTRCGQCLWL